MRTIKFKKKAELILLIIIILALSWFSVELSSGYATIKDIFQLNIRFILLNIMTNFVLLSILIIVSNRYWLAALIYSILFFIISVANYFTCKLHGFPLSIQELGNIKTALNVISAYKLKIDFFVGGFFLIFCINILMSIMIKKKCPNCIETKKIVVRDAVLIGVSITVIWVGYFSPKSIKPNKTIGWLWEVAYHKYGYSACTFETLYSSFNIIEKPKGYDEEHLEEISIVPCNRNRTQKPDIILILNESFYDLSLITDLNVDCNYLQNIDTMPNLIKGYAFVHGVGGGTNGSEYELLTSNSLQLMKGIVPFNALNMKGANSIVSHLNNLGYTTTSMHSEPAVNYRRGIAYPAMGFDLSYFDPDFENRTYYGERWYETDECLYDNLIAWYEEAIEKSDEPQFMYLLTIQNHGGWEFNPSEMDIVHAETDYGEYDEQVDEFLSCLSLSDKAFKKLMDYFETVNRDVIVIMCGDHAPSFARYIVDADKKANEDFLLRCTPLYIGTNYDIEVQDVNVISLNYVLPTVLEIGNINVSPYYDYMLNIKSQIPVLTSIDLYYDSGFNKYQYNASSKYSEMVNNYLNLEYANLKNKGSHLFKPY